MGQNVTGDDAELVKYLTWAAQQPKTPEGYTHYGPANAGVTLPTGSDYNDSLLRGGWDMVSGNNPYFPGGTTGRDELSLGGSPSQPLPPLSTLPKQGADSAGGLPNIITNPGSAIGRPGGGLSLGGGGGVTGPAQQPAIDWSSVVTPPRHGYESSSNKDFYQRQFQQQEGQQNAQKLRELAAAARAQQVASAPTPAPQDPWSWANLPEVKVGGTVAATPIEWGLNPSYGITKDMTNQQALNAISGVLTPEEQAIFSAQFTANPASATGTNWVNAGSPGALTNRSSDAALSPEFLAARAKIANNIYTQTGGGTGGITVPTGYANPIGA